MSKAHKIYSLDRDVAKTINLRSVNPTVRAILKGLWHLSSDKQFEGITGDAVLAYCVQHNLWTTKQDPDRYITTWAYYVKTLKQLGVIETGYSAGEIGDSEYLGEEASEEQEVVEEELT